MAKRLKYLFFILIFILVLAGLATWQFPWVQAQLGLSTEEDKALAYKSAEFALKEGELWLSQQTTRPIAVKHCDHPPCLVWQRSSLPKNLSDQKNIWWETQGRLPLKKMPTVTTQPRYVIEEKQFEPQTLDPDDLSKARGYAYYRLTAKGKGNSKSGESQSILESIYAIKYN